MKRIQIWNDNNESKNYQLYFDKPDVGAPDVLTLSETDEDKNNPPENWAVEFVGKGYVDAADTHLQEQIDKHDERLELIEEKNTEQDSRLDLIEEKNAEQDDRLDAIDGANGTQDGRLDLIEQKNDEQDEHLANLEERVTVNRTEIEINMRSIAELQTEMIDDTCKLVEVSKPYIIEDFPIGIYRVEANLRIEFLSETEVLPVMGLMVVSIDSDVKETYFNLTKSDITRGNIADVNVSFFNRDIDMSALVNRETNLKGFVTMDLTDFTYDNIFAGSPYDAEQNLRLDALEEKDLDLWSLIQKNFTLIQQNSLRITALENGITINGDYLPLIGGEMSGTINMGTNPIVNINSLTIGDVPKGTESHVNIDIGGYQTNYGTWFTELMLSGLNGFSGREEIFVRGSADLATLSDSWLTEYGFGDYLVPVNSLYRTLQSYVTKEELADAISREISESAITLMTNVIEYVDNKTLARIEQSSGPTVDSYTFIRGDGTTVPDPIMIANQTQYLQMLETKINELENRINNL